MAHPQNDLINRLENKTPVECSIACKYWKFPHLETACVLSEVFSVKKGEPCFEFDPEFKHCDRCHDTGCEQCQPLAYQ